MNYTRRSVLSGLCAGSANLLFSRRVLAAGHFAAAAEQTKTALPGLLDLNLTALSPNALRISISPANDPPRLQELGVLDRQEALPLARPGPEKDQVISWGKYTLRIQASPLRIAVVDAGKVRQQVQFAPDSTDVRFDLDGPVFGLGEGVHSFDRRGTQDEMINGQNGEYLRTFGARLPIPWVISPSGWGLFVGQPSGSFSFSQTEGVFRGAEATSTRNVYLLLGDRPEDVLREYAHLTGFPHLPPLWAFGYQQSHRTLGSRQEILDEARTFRAKKLPCDAMIYLGTGFCPSGWNSGHGSFTFNADVFPDPSLILRQMHEDHFKVILHVVPPGDFHGRISDRGAAAEAPGDAAAYWAKHTEVAKTGVDGWWPDEGDRLSVYARLQRNEMYWEGSRQEQPDKRPFALHRNGYAGLQRYGWLWSGDTFSTWNALRAQIMNGINTGLSGISYWGSDTGGFVPTVEFTPELFVRWFQFSAFCPSFRSHGRAWKLHLPWGWDLGTAEPKEVTGDWVAAWPPPADLHRPEIEGICRTYLNLRYQMLPYLYGCAAQAHTTGMPILRALWLKYPQDSKATGIDDSYLWGDNFLVAPVYEKGATQRSVYLPEGGWWNYWTGQQITGGQQITVAAPLDTLPLFVKAGAIFPLGPIKQYSGEETGEPVTLRIYPGADGRFTWYDDDGSSFRYEQGQFLQVACEWSDSSRVLTLTRVVEGKLGAGRAVRVVLAGTDQGKSVTLNRGVTRVQL